MSLRDIGLPALLACAGLLALLPWGWALMYRDPRRRRQEEGRSDGLLLLGAFVFSLFALVMGGAAVVRMNRETGMLRASTPVKARVESCSVISQRTGGRNANQVHELRCGVLYDLDGRTFRGDVSAGFPSRRQAYDEWVRLHPPGSVIALRRGTGDGAGLSGFADLVPSTTSARAAASVSLLFGAVSFALLAASRAVVAWRRRGRAARGAA